MIICDKCKQPVKTKVHSFGYVGTDWRNLPNYDLCEDCAEKVKYAIDDDKGRVRRIWT